MNRNHISANALNMVAVALQALSRAGVTQTETASVSRLLQSDNLANSSELKCLYRDLADFEVDGGWMCQKGGFENRHAIMFATLVFEYLNRRTITIDRARVRAADGIIKLATEGPGKFWVATALGNLGCPEYFPTTFPRS